MTSIHEETTVAIVGAGVSGLTLATFLTRSGVDCVVLERRNRPYIEMRQRAGVVEARGVRMFERWGLAERILGGPVAPTIDYRVNGVSRVFETTSDDGSESRFCTQQMTFRQRIARARLDTVFDSPTAARLHSEFQRGTV